MEKLAITTTTEEIFKVDGGSFLRTCRTVELPDGTILTLPMRDEDGERGDASLMWDGEKSHKFTDADNDNLQLQWHFFHGGIHPAEGTTSVSLTLRGVAKNDTDVGHNRSAGQYCRIDGDYLIIED